MFSLIPHGPGPRSQRGFTLLEVMIAVVVFSIGLLGIAGLQVAGMRFTHGSQLRTLAVMQAENMADRMRANLGGVSEGYYNKHDNDMPTSITTDCDTSPCTELELAQFHLVTWNEPRGAGSSRPPESNADVLPGGAGVVCLDASPDDGVDGDWQCDNSGNVYAIKVTWTERTLGADDLGDTDGDGSAEVGDTAIKRVVLRVIP